MLAYKLTDQNMQTRGGFQWTLGVPAETSGDGGLCSPGMLHFYDDPLVAVFLNPIHADFTNPRLFEAEAEGEILSEHGLKFGCTKLTLIREIELPKPTRINHVAFGILCPKKVCNNPDWNRWADRWLSGEDRSVEAAWAAAEAAARAARAAAWAAAAEAAARAAAWAAEAAAWAAMRATPLDLKAIAKQAMEVK